MTLASIAELVAEREQLRVALYETANCKYAATDPDAVGDRGCRCRSLALKVLGDYKPSNLALKKFWNGGSS